MKFRLNKRLLDDAGFTLVEIIIVIVITGLLTGIFGELLYTSMRIYTEHNVRKTAHIDMRRALDMLTNSIREWRSWYGFQSPTRLDFYKYEWTSDYYHNLRIAFEFNNDKLEYRRADDGNFNNRYAILEDVNGRGTTSRFTITTAGGVQRVAITTLQSINGKPMRIRTVVFPRQQGG